MLPIVQRKELYQDFATLFSYPGTELVEQLQQKDRWAAVAEQFGMPLPEEVTAFPRATLEETYTALFDAGLGGAVAPPYGSVYLDQSGLLMGPSTLQVAACYAETGLNLEGTVEPADFLPTELEYLYYLVDREARALQAKDLVIAREMTDRQRRFLATWLLTWLPEFVARLETRPQLALYPWAGRLLLAFCQAELEWLNRLEKTGR
jgi:putative dimethyl sulfoxide reductase chaperone